MCVSRVSHKGQRKKNFTKCVEVRGTLWDRAGTDLEGKGVAAPTMAACPATGPAASASAARRMGPKQAAKDALAGQVGRAGRAAVLAVCVGRGWRLVVSRTAAAAAAAARPAAAAVPVPMPVTLAVAVCQLLLAGSHGRRCCQRLGGLQRLEAGARGVARSGQCRSTAAGGRPCRG